MPSIGVRLQRSGVAMPMLAVICALLSAVSLGDDGLRLLAASTIILLALGVPTLKRLVHSTETIGRGTTTY